MTETPRPDERTGHTTDYWPAREAGLRNWARGAYAAMAAAELLIAHDSLLRHIDGAGLLDYKERRYGEPLAVIDWDRLGELGYLSGGESVCLDFAWAMVDHEHPVDLSDLSRLDVSNRLLVLAALAYVAGDANLHAELADRAAADKAAGRPLLDGPRPGSPVQVVAEAREERQP